MFTLSFGGRAVPYSANSKIAFLPHGTIDQDAIEVDFDGIALDGSGLIVAQQIPAQSRLVGFAWNGQFNSPDQMPSVVVKWDGYWPGSRMRLANQHPNGQHYWGPGITAGYLTEQTDYVIQAPAGAYCSVVSEFLQPGDFANFTLYFETL